MSSDKQLRILYFGPAAGNSISRLQGMQALGHHAELALPDDPFSKAPRIIQSIEWRLCNGPVTRRLNRLFLEKAMSFHPDIVWVEMGRLVYAKTLRQIKEATGCVLVNTYSDDFRNPKLRSRHFDRGIPLYDFIFTPRESNFPEMLSRGARRVEKFWKGYRSDILFPEALSPSDRDRFGCDVVFVGHAEQNRVETLSMLATEVPLLRIWGYGWDRFELPKHLADKVVNEWVEGESYRKALCGGKIALHFLSKWNRDTQSSRTFEIPACGVLMLAERTDDHLALFEEDREAVFFSSKEELVEKCRFYLSHDTIRQTIAQAGFDRCKRSGYSNQDRIAQMLATIRGAV